MHEKDYLMRSIQQFGSFLARVLSGISKGSLEETELDLEVGAERYLGLRLDLVLSMSNDALMDLFGQRGSLEFGKIYIAAQLLRCEAGVRDAAGCETSRELYLRSLGFLLQGYPEMDESFEGAASLAIEQILSSMNGREVPVEMCERLLAFQEYRGQYAKAENRLFELLDRGSDQVLELGESFYARMLETADEELENGNLPRSEVLEGMSELRSRCKS